EDVGAGPRGRHPSPHGGVDGAADPPSRRDDTRGSDLPRAADQDDAPDAQPEPHPRRGQVGDRVSQAQGRRSRRVARVEEDAMKPRWAVTICTAALAALSFHLVGCAGRTGADSAAQKVYVKPGEHDTYYAFFSGGHSGQVFVYGIPSCRYITTIPVFTPEPAKGYGVDEESRAMLKGFTWGDAHHPGLSETDGDYDGRWLFLNDMPNARIARSDLKDFTTREIFVPTPNLSTSH